MGRRPRLLHGHGLSELVVRPLALVVRALALGASRCLNLLVVRLSDGALEIDVVSNSVLLKRPELKRGVQRGKRVVPTL